MRLLATGGCQIPFVPLSLRGRLSRWLLICTGITLIPAAHPARLLYVAPSFSPPRLRSLENRLRQRRATHHITYWLRSERLTGYPLQGIDFGTIVHDNPLGTAVEIARFMLDPSNHPRPLNEVGIVHDQEIGADGIMEVVHINETEPGC